MVKKAKMWGSVLAKSKFVVWLRILLRKAAQSESVQNIKAKILMKLAGEQQQQGSQLKYDSAKRVMADGFRVTIKYRDGEIASKSDDDFEDDLPQQVRDHIAKMTRRAIMKADHIGLKPSMEESETLTRIFAQTRHIWENGLKKLQSQLQVYRRGLAQAHTKQNAALSDDFWLHVYNNPHLPYKKLKRYLRLKESNPLLQNLPETHKLALDSLYARQKWAFRDPRTTCWFVFWDDVYACNSDMKLDPKDFDPLEPTSICYREPMVRQELEEWLRQRKLLHKWRKFNPALLDLLYEKMRDCSK